MQSKTVRGAARSERRKDMKTFNQLRKLHHDSGKGERYWAWQSSYKNQLHKIKESIR